MGTVLPLLEEQSAVVISEVHDVSVFWLQCLVLHVFLHLLPPFLPPFEAEAQQNRERVIQTVDSAVQGADGRHLTPGLHQLPVRPITQNGRHTSAVVATETSLASGKNSVSHCQK